MTLKLNGSTAGSVSIDAPADTSPTGTDVTLTLPTSAGSSGQYLQTNGSGTLSWQTVEGLPDAIDVNASAPADSVNIDSSGRLLVGTQTARTNVKRTGSTVFTPTVQFETSSGNFPYYSILNNSSSGYDPHLVIGLSKANGIGSNGLATNGAGIGQIHFVGNDGTNFISAASIIAQVDGTSGTDDMPGRLIFSTTADGASFPTERLKLAASGDVYSVGIYNQGSSWAANVGVGSNGILYRSTSSIKYKTDVETLQDSYADALLECRPVWYHSLCENDNPEHSFWGFIAEEVAEIDPRLVHWKTFEVTYDETGSAVETPCDPEPEGVAYDRFVPHLINLIKRQKEQLESQAATIAALDARLTALEGGAS